MRRRRALTSQVDEEPATRQSVARGATAPSSRPPPAAARRSTSRPTKAGAVRRRGVSQLDLEAAAAPTVSFDVRRRRPRRRQAAPPTLKLCSAASAAPVQPILEVEPPGGGSSQGGAGVIPCLRADEVSAAAAYGLRPARLGSAAGGRAPR